jgi:hypothetical protein
MKRDYPLLFAFLFSKVKKSGAGQRGYSYPGRIAAIFAGEVPEQLEKPGRLYYNFLLTEKCAGESFFSVPGFFIF